MRQSGPQHVLRAVSGKRSDLLLLSPFFWSGFFLWLRGTLWMDLSLWSGSGLGMRLVFSMRRILGFGRYLWMWRALRTRCGFLRRGLCRLCILRFRRSRLRSLWRRRTFMLRRVRCRTSRTGLLRSARPDDPLSRHADFRLRGVAVLFSAAPGWGAVFAACAADGLAAG